MNLEVSSSEVMNPAMSIVEAMESFKVRNPKTNVVEVREIDLTKNDISDVSRGFPFQDFTC